LPAVIIPVVLAVLALNIYRARRRVFLLFRETTPDRAIAYYDSSMRQIPNGKAMAAYLSGFAAVHYGQFDRAREELAAVNWTHLPPMYQGFETSVHALLAIFEARDYSRALSLAQEARDLCGVSSAFPGSKASRAALESYVDVCELLMGQTSSELLDRLRAAVINLPGISPALPAWALAVYYQKQGQDAVAAEYLAVVRRLVPHCACLNDVRSVTPVTITLN
jgi:tetratricopeptide (TPR) repeat protein